MRAEQIFHSDDFRTLLDQCIHCGLCLPACPTYQTFRTEMESPRGRIALMRAASTAAIPTIGAFRHHMDLCLGCRSCETACPSGVRYGALLDVTRAALEETHPPPAWQRTVRRLLLRDFLPRRDRLQALARVLRIYQRIRLHRLVQALPILPHRLRSMAALQPPLSATFVSNWLPAPAIGRPRGKVALFYGCVQDAFLSGVNAATVRVLQRNGYEVHFPPGQTCCGAAALHVGELELARDLARRNVDALEAGGYVAILNNAGGCGAALKGYGHLLENDPLYADRAHGLVQRMQDISEFLADNLHAEPGGVIRARVTYVDSCHLRHVQRIVDQPRDLLRRVPGISLVELAHPDLCCGSAGVYNILQPDSADQILDAKMVDVRATEADLIVTTNTGCHLQLLAGAKRAGIHAQVIHLVELLDRSYAQSR